MNTWFHHFREIFSYTLYTYTYIEKEIENVSYHNTEASTDAVGQAHDVLGSNPGSVNGRQAPISSLGWAISLIPCTYQLVI